MTADSNVYGWVFLSAAFSSELAPPAISTAVYLTGGPPARGYQSGAEVILDCLIDRGASGDAEL